MKYHIITYGCQMNKSDSERIAQALESSGYQPALRVEEADLIVVNMCSVRQSAVDRVHGLIPRLRQGFGGQAKLKTILTGCILKKDKKKFAKDFDYILNIQDLSKWPKILEKGSGTNSHDRENLCLTKESTHLEIEPKHFNNFSAFVPIMTGCNNFCAYCVVPYVRGREIPRLAEEVLCEVKNLIKRDYKEIWLLGQSVNSYNAIPFPRLLRKINKIPGNFWIRFTSSHPKYFSNELIDTMAECKKVTEYLNLPIQAGDNKVLKKMNRHYTVVQYKSLVKKIRKKIPNIALSTDVIVGFPGETKKQFENTAKLFKEVKFDMAYIAKYSPRPGTAAEKLKDNVPQKEKDRREKVLTKILKESALENNKKYIGKEIEVLVNSHKSYKSRRSHNSLWLGKTRTHKNVQFESDKNLLGEFAKVKITNALPWGLKGEIS